MNILQYITLNKSQQDPLYLQLAASIEEAILKGYLKHGEYLPTEKLLCDAFDISPKVVLSAYQHLSEKNLVVRMVGKGTTVNNRIRLNVNFKNVLSAGDSFPVVLKKVYQDDVFNDGRIPIERPEIKSFHQVAMVHDHPIYFRKTYLHPEVYPPIDDIDDIFATSQRLFNVNDLEFHSKMMVVNLPTVEAAYLNVEPQSAGFYLRTLIKKNDQVIGFVRTYFSGEFTVWSDDPETIQF